MKRKGFVFALFSVQMLAATSLMYASVAAAAGDPSAGEDVFASECSDCHSVVKGKNKKGPSLFGVLGRKSATISDFKYSDAMRKYNVVWTPENIDAYITLPKKAVPGGKMKYDGLKDAKSRADLLAFLATKK